MQATRSLLYKGFIGRSLDEFKRLSHIVFSLEGIKGAKTPYEIHNFHAPESIGDCKLMSDQEIGGFSSARLEWVKSEAGAGAGGPAGYARFYGAISTKLPKDRPDVKRTGYAAFRTKDRPPTIFGRSLHNIDPYAYLALRVRSDGRSYFVNVLTESVVPTDLHQHRLFVKRPGRWETVLIKWNDFVRTNYGVVVEPQTELLRAKVKSVGIGLTDRIPGPFELCIERMWATNDESEADVLVDLTAAPAEKAEEAPSPPPQREGKLKTKEGKRVSWDES
ncbi:hypothetical protein VTJ83DRAFT_1613 [Remersonia thermophila]|uniref:NADH:ubiquinone oxidoreductase intermediate-associated protein 30 domain-containing protein n=1 Tax=Remersonia thermophila TaxID=72144 RepID=A0ABR4DIQ9_9PEZI